MRKILISILMMFGFLALTSPALAETTLPFFMRSNDIDPNVRFDDGTCGSRVSRYCCHSRVQYNCRFLMRQFSAGYCRPDRNDLSNNSWRRCENLPALPDIDEEREAAIAPARGTYPMTRGTGAFQYAAALTRCAGYGRGQAYSYARSRGRSSGAGYCAVGVRTALACMAREFGQRVGDRQFHCGGSAYDYFGCLENKGFDLDMSACNRPGVIRVYRGYRQGNPNYSGGDRHGHIEFLGTDGMWHAGVQSSLPIDQRLGSNRRQLRGCYVWRGGGTAR